MLRQWSPLIREGAVAESLHVGSPNEHHHAKLDPITISNTRIGAALSLLTIVTHAPDCQASAIYRVIAVETLADKLGTARRMGPSHRVGVADALALWTA